MDRLQEERRDGPAVLPRWGELHRRDPRDGCGVELYLSTALDHPGGVGLSSVGQRAAIAARLAADTGMDACLAGARR